MEFDLLVIGVEREGIERAISAAQDDAKVAILQMDESEPTLDILRLAANNVADCRDIDASAWRTEVSRLHRLQMIADKSELDCLGILQIEGQARFISAQSVEVSMNAVTQIVSAPEIIVACGTRSRCPKSLGVDDRSILKRESLLQMESIPRSAIVVGAGESGLMVAMTLATLGVEVTIVDGKVSLNDMYGMFGFVAEAAQSLNIAFRLGDEAIGVEVGPDRQTAVRLSSGRVFGAETVVVCVGREGKTEQLNLESIGVGLDERGRLWCDVYGKTWVPGITAVGEMIGFPQSTTSRQPNRFLIPHLHFPLSNSKKEIAMNS